METTYVMFSEGKKWKEIKSMYLFHCGNYFHDKKNIDKGIIYYKKALGLNADNYYAHTGLGAAYLEKGLFREALDFFDKAISIRKPDILASILLFITYESLGESDIAQEVLKTILRFFKNNEPATYDRIGYTYRQLGMYKEAEHYIKKAIEISPTEGGPHYNLAKIFLAQDNLRMAKEEFQKVLELKIQKRFKRYATYYLRMIDQKSEKLNRS